MRLRVHHAYRRNDVHGVRRAELQFGLGNGVRRAVLQFGLAVLLVALCAIPASAQMPDPRMMAGRAVPAGDLPAGTVTVRVVRESLANNLPGVQVELHGAGQTRVASTDANGRATFSRVTAGARVHAVATVAGERLESSEFEVPGDSGVRTILVAGISATSPPPEVPGRAPGAPATATGALALGSNTRFAIEFQDDTLAVFYLLEIVNSSPAPVALPSALVFDMPREAVGTSLLEGASPLANAKGPRVTVSGPIPPGVTEVPIAFRLESWGSTLTIAQSFPVALDQIAMAVQQIGDVRVQSAQAPSIRQASLQGRSFLIASGPAVPAGTAWIVTLSNLPHHSPTPLRVALVLAGGIVAIGVWLASRQPASLAPDARTRAIRTRRERALTALAALETDHRAGRLDAIAYDRRRDALLQELERLYAELDALGALEGGDRGLAA